jgi:hypothetical protein
MRKLLMIVSAAAMAVSMPALAEKGGKGGGHGGGKGDAAQSHGSGHGGGEPAKAERRGGGGHAAKPHKAERQAFRGGGKPDKVHRQAFRGSGKPDKPQREAFRGGGKPDKQFRKAVKSEQRFARDRFEDRRGDRVRDVRGFSDDRARLAGFDRGCPPGLAKKGNGCLPPGQAKKVFGLGDRIQPAWFSGYAIPAEYRGFYADTSDHYYRYDDQGYVYRVDSGTNLISGLIPLLGGGFAVGQPLPSGFDAYNVPLAYRDDYYDTEDYSYRYADDAIYRVDGDSGIIDSIVALLAGDLNVGQALPDGYDVYNLPTEYREEYSDNEDYKYRYADGNIYQVDAKTQIIQAIVEMLA